MSVDREEKLLAIERAGENMWTFTFPRLTWEVLEEFHEALEYWRAGYLTDAEEEYLWLLEEFPEFIDVHHHLALVLRKTDRKDEAFQVWQETVQMGLDCLPEEFEIGQDTLPWIILENRPFLRAYHGLGLEYLERGKTERALEIFEDILAMNPNDNQGVRALAIDCHFRLGHPEQVLEICDQYPNDGLEQVIYGRALALLQLGRQAEAEQALTEAVEWLPLVGEELVKKRHRRPSNLNPDYVTHGGADQAYYYWKDQGQHWENTPGAVELVRECLQKVENQ
jgi:tetratricopeptide (TPR) repeat protein